jgi:hypothetical protein
MPQQRAAALTAALDVLERAYGRLVPSSDPLEAGAMALLATHAPALATEESRDRIRQSFCDWNEARTADAWDVTNALDADADPAARSFARALLRFLESVHAVLNRCSFEVPAGEPAPDWAASVEKMRGAPPAVRAVCLASLTAPPGWHATPDIVKSALRLELVAKTTSAPKVAAGLAEICREEDRLRAHYLLARWGARAKEDPDPLGGEDGKKKPAKSARPAKASKREKPARAGKD